VGEPLRHTCEPGLRIREKLVWIVWLSVDYGDGGSIKLFLALVSDMWRPRTSHRARSASHKFPLCGVRVHR